MYIKLNLNNLYSLVTMLNIFLFSNKKMFGLFRMRLSPEQIEKTVYRITFSYTLYTDHDTVYYIIFCLEKGFDIILYEKFNKTFD